MNKGVKDEDRGYMGEVEKCIVIDQSKKRPKKEKKNNDIYLCSM